MSLSTRFSWIMAAILRDSFRLVFTYDGVGVIKELMT